MRGNDKTTPPVTLKKTLLIAGVGVALLAGIALGFWKASASAKPKFDTVYQAVLLDNGQVYYGKLEGLGTAFPVLTEVYYVEHQVNPQTKEVKNVLVRRGTEWHAPDRMILVGSHIVLVEPVSPSSKVAQLISDLKSQNH